MQQFARVITWPARWALCRWLDWAVGRHDRARIERHPWYRWLLQLMHLRRRLRWGRCCDRPAPRAGCLDRLLRTGRGGKECEG